ncbi:hypothetical protein EUX98_g1462 [Antrodiella citrinella]|uniref:DEAD/DEAH-box helicase domain-containing protein n=1 Tax=Antrodiella citrinella TaxID=2447956 RepID=A0A4S4N1I1_9APHY|nr:hypothetical protein EUX98_g1462 [Antrodiella citrinella]
MSLDSSATPRKFTFSSLEGRVLCKKILAESTPWPHEPHDFQLEGACKALDGIDVLAVTPTGSGKSLLIIYMLLYSAIANDPALCPASQLKVKNPAMVFVCPIKALQYDMEPKFRTNGLATVVTTLRPPNERIARARSRCGAVED